MTNLVVKLDIYKNNRIKSKLPWFTNNIKNACKKNKNYILNSLMTKVLNTLFKF